MKVRYCVNNELFGVLHLHPKERKRESFAPFVLWLSDDEFLKRCKKLKKGDDVVVELDDQNRVVEFTAGNGKS